MAMARIWLIEFSRIICFFFTVPFRALSSTANCPGAVRFVLFLFTIAEIEFIFFRHLTYLKTKDFGLLNCVYVKYYHFFVCSLKKSISYFILGMLYKCKFRNLESIIYLFIFGIGVTFRSFITREKKERKGTKMKIPNSWS